VDAQIGVECTSVAVCHLILCMHGKAAQLKDVKFVMLDAFEYAAEHGDEECLVRALDVSKRGNWRLPATYHLQSQRGLVCMEKLIQHVLTSDLDSIDGYRACEWLGIGMVERAPLIVRTLALAQKCALQAFF